MVGIVSYGAYIPYYRLDYQDVAKAWGTALPQGQRAVANFDEDSITMAVTASLNCLTGIDRETVDGLYFASTTSPYKEKQSAALIASAVDLRRNIASIDFANSLRSGTNAMSTAVNAIRGDSAKRILITAADCRLGTPQSTLEYTLGDGAASVLLGDSDVVATIEQSYSISDEMLDYWRFDTDTFIKTWEDRFILQKGYLEVVQEAVSELMKKYNVSPRDFTKVIYYAPDERSHARIAQALGFDLEAQVQDSLVGVVGNTGSAYALMLLAAALDEAKAEDRILFVSYGDGCDAFILHVTENIEKIRAGEHKPLKDFLASGKKLPSYEKYMAFRNITPVETVRRAEYPSSASLMWREREQIIRFHGYKCRRCGAVQVPRPDNIRVCVKCQAIDELDRVSLSDRNGEIVAFAQDHIFASVDPPTIQVLINLEGGGRFFGFMTDRDLDKIKVGTQVKMTFRKMSDAAGFHNYYWKVKLID